MNPKRIGFLGYDGLQALDLVGPLEAFMTAVADESNGNGKQQDRYEVLVIGLTNEPFTAETGIVFHPHETIESAPALDTLIIPGGKSLRSGETSTKISEWLMKARGQDPAHRLSVHRHLRVGSNRPARRQAGHNSLALCA